MWSPRSPPRMERLALILTYSLRHPFYWREGRCTKHVPQVRKEAGEATASARQKDQGIEPPREGKAQSCTCACEDRGRSQGLPAQAINQADKREPSDRH